MYSLDAHFDVVTPGCLTAQHDVLLQVIDGTLSAAKSTPIEAYIASRPQLADEDLDLPAQRVRSILFPGEAEPRPLLYDYRCITEEIDGVIVPIIVIPETARQYADRQLFRNVLTTDYTAADQMAITIQQSFAFSRAVSSAAVMASKLQPDRQRTISGVLSDRGPMAGFAFGYTRLPNDEHTMGDLGDHLVTNSNQSIPIDVLADAIDTTRHLDRVLLADFTEVELKDDGQRVIDQAFRLRIANEIAWLYRWALRGDSDRIGTLSGSQSIRPQVIMDEMRSILHDRLFSLDNTTL